MPKYLHNILVCVFRQGTNYKKSSVNLFITHEALVYISVPVTFGTSRRRNFVCDDGDLSPCHFWQWCCWLSPPLFQSGESYLSCYHAEAFCGLNMQKMRQRPGHCPGPRRGSSRRSPDPLVGWGADTPPHTPLGAFGASIVVPPWHQILATPLFKIKLRQCSGWHCDDTEFPFSFQHDSICLYCFILEE